jgi:hypothetical protein
MKNKTFYLCLLLAATLIFASCARKGYGCPATVSIQKPAVEKNTI